jgi:hypothetical protein
MLFVTLPLRPVLARTAPVSAETVAKTGWARPIGRFVRVARPCWIAGADPVVHDTFMRCVRPRGRRAVPRGGTMPGAQPRRTLRDFCQSGCISARRLVVRDVLGASISAAAAGSFGARPSRLDVAWGRRNDRVTRGVRRTGGVFARRVQVRRSAGAAGNPAPSRGEPPLGGPSHANNGPGGGVK